VKCTNGKRCQWDVREKTKGQSGWVYSTKVPNAKLGDPNEGFSVKGSIARKEYPCFRSI
jgi:hypothetical protein